MEAIKVRLLRDDGCSVPRFLNGEEGFMLVNDYPEKYDYFVRLPKVAGPLKKQSEILSLLGKEEWWNRDFYFYADEIQILGPAEYTGD